MTRLTDIGLGVFGEHLDSGFGTLYSIHPVIIAIVSKATEAAMITVSAYAFLSIFFNSGIIDRTITVVTTVKLTFY
jgi:hypothetical protein